MLVYQGAVALALAGVALLVWRNHQDYRRPAARWPEGGAGPLVSILVPARNEAENIGGCLEGLLRQTYPRWELVVLDDGSTDGTGELIEERARGEARLRRVPGGPLPAGWAGKAHACWQAAQHARGEWLLFLDADTRAEPELVSAALAEARETGADFLSTFPRQEIGSAGEAVTVPFIYWVLFTLLPLRMVWESPYAACVAACGQFLLVRREAYFAVEGHRALRHSLHDGLHLARLLKGRGYRVRLADLSGLISCRMYRGWAECWSGFTRNAFQALGSFPALVVVSGLEVGLFLLPFVFLVAAVAQGWPRWGWAVLAQVGLLLGIQVSLRGRFGYPWGTVGFHPVGIAALVLIQWASWGRSRSRRPVVWKGRVVEEAARGGSPTGEP